MRASRTAWKLVSSSWGLMTERSSFRDSKRHFNLCGARIDPWRGEQIGAPFSADAIRLVRAGVDDVEGHEEHLDALSGVDR
jgi:hypothetical protein